MSTTTRDDHAGSSRGNSVEGSTFFAGMMLSILAVFQVFQGIGAIAGDDVYVRGLNYTFEFDLTTWGWIHLIVGLVALATGIGLTMGQSWAYPGRPGDRVPERGVQLRLPALLPPVVAGHPRLRRLRDLGDLHRRRSATTPGRHQGGSHP